MARIFSLCLVVFTLNSGIMAQKSIRIEREITINVSADKLWKMVGPGFVEVYKWSSNVDHAEGKGTSPFEGAVCDERFCEVNVKGFSKISEKLTAYDASRMNLAYTVQHGMPGFVSHAENDWTVVPLGTDHAKLVMKGKFEVTGLMGRLMRGTMEKKMAQTLETVLHDAKVYAETGQVSDTKAARMQKLTKKLERKAA